MFDNSKRKVIGVIKMNYESEPQGVFFMIDNKSFYASCESVARGLNPLQSVLVVMSETENTGGGGLILAASPTAKKRYGISNVSRRRDLPNVPEMIIAPPRMNLYIHKNLAVNRTFRDFCADEDCYPYSIDESILDMTKSWQLFGSSPMEVAQEIQHTIRHKYGLYTTVGIGRNPLQAKLALDIYAKHDHNLIGELSYGTFGKKIWPITDLTSVWSIGHRTADHLNRMGIFSMDDLAHCNPYELKSEMGVIGSQLFALSWGIDRSKLSKLINPVDKSWSNSQVLPRDYSIQREIELVISEIGQQVTSRMRHHRQAASVISLGLGFSYSSSEEDGRSGFHRSIKVETTSSTAEINEVLMRLFRQNWEGQSIRNVMVSLSQLSEDTGLQLSLFEAPEPQIKRDNVDRIMDKIRDRFGVTKLIMASSLLRGGTMLERASLVGGHNGGNSYD